MIIRKFIFRNRKKFLALLVITTILAYMYFNVLRPLWVFRFINNSSKDIYDYLALSMVGDTLRGLSAAEYVANLIRISTSYGSELFPNGIPLDSKLSERVNFGSKDIGYHITLALNGNKIKGYSNDKIAHAAFLLDKIPYLLPLKLDPSSIRLLPTIRPIDIFDLNDLRISLVASIDSKHSAILRWLVVKLGLVEYDNIRNIYYHMTLGTIEPSSTSYIGRLIWFLKYIPYRRGFGIIDYKFRGNSILDMSLVLGQSFYHTIKSRLATFIAMLT